jgi:hypothetical protein
MEGASKLASAEDSWVCTPARDRLPRYWHVMTVFEASSWGSDVRN